MTFTKTLAESQNNGMSVTATENHDKYSSVPYYRVLVSKYSMAYIEIKTARTTWRRKFREVVAQYLR